MKYVDEYRDRDAASRYVDAIRRACTKHWCIMEICGGQTHSIVRFGIDELLPEDIELLHGPGCPVCVTPVESIDRALAIASRPEVTFCSFGDMLRVPGSNDDLFAAKSRGADVRVVYSPMDALELARKNPHRQVVFFAVGFETTAPANAMAVYEAHRTHVENFSLLVSHVLVPPAMEAILASAENRVNGFLAAGHVCTIMGTEEYAPLAEKYRVPIVVTGFEPVDILQGIYLCVRQLEDGRAELENQYRRSVRAHGNPAARARVEEVFEVVSRRFRGLGEIPRGGLATRGVYRQYDAEVRFADVRVHSEETEECQSSRVLRGLIKPAECPAFGTRCTPERPLGAPMVSSEGACAAYYRYRRGAA